MGAIEQQGERRYANIIIYGIDWEDWLRGAIKGIDCGERLREAIEGSDQASKAEGPTYGPTNGSTNRLIHQPTVAYVSMYAKTQKL